MAEVASVQTRELLAKVLRGEPFAKPGARDTTLQKVASAVGYLEPDEAADVLVQVMDASIRHFQDVDAGTYTHEDNIRWARDKIARAQARKRTERAANHTVAEGLARAACAVARAAPRGPDLPEPPEDSWEKYSEEELQAFADQQACSVSDFRQRWVIQKGSNFWVYVNGRYQAPVTLEEFATCAYRDLAPADGIPGGVRLDTLDSRGNTKRKTPRQLLDDYATVARHLEASLVAKTSRFQADDQRFVEAVCAVRDLQPVFHAPVDQWLRLLGGSQADKLLDWVASATELARQSCAVFFFGSPGTGKTLFAHGLARLWTTGGPTELKRVLGDWSADLARCPLVLADEQIPDLGRGRTSADLRELVGSTCRTLTRKYLHNAELVGAVRLVLAANSFSMLALNEVLGTDDLDAVAARFLFVKVDGPARDYLESISTTDWVNGNVIAEHALWLRENRLVHPGKRFLVEGQQSSWTRLLAVQGPVPGMVAEWLSRCLADQAQKAGPRQRGTVLVRDHHLYVRSQALLDFWDLYVKNQRQPHAPAISAALANLSRRKVRHDNFRYFEIDTDTLIAWADEHLICSEEELLAGLTREDPPATRIDGAVPPGTLQGRNPVPAALAAAGVTSAMIDRFQKRGLPQ